MTTGPPGVTRMGSIRSVLYTDVTYFDVGTRPCRSSARHRFSMTWRRTRRLCVSREGPRLLGCSLLFYRREEMEKRRYREGVSTIVKYVSIMRTFLKMTSSLFVSSSRKERGSPFRTLKNSLKDLSSFVQSFFGSRTPEGDVSGS